MRDLLDVMGLAAVVTFAILIAVCFLLEVISRWI